MQAQRRRPTACPHELDASLQRVFAIDIETRPECGGNLRVIACIEDPPLIAKISGQVRRREALAGTGCGLPACGETRCG